MTIWCGVTVVISLCALIIKIYERSQIRGEDKCRNTGKMKLFYNHFIFPLTVFNFIFTFASVYINSLRLSDEVDTFTRIQNGPFCTILMMFSASVFATQFCSPQQKDTKERKLYVLLFLLRLLLLSVLFSLGITLKYDFLVYPILLLMVLYLVAILKLRPYNSCFSNLCIVLY